MPISNSQDHSSASSPSSTLTSVMLRSILHFPSLSHFKSTTQLAKYTNPTLFDPIQRKPTPRIGTIADILDILAPLDSSLPPSASKLYAGLLRKCVRSRNSLMGASLHVHLIKLGLNDGIWVWNVLLDVYVKAGLLDDCVDLFDRMPDRDLVSWCTLISGFVARGLGLEAVGLFRRLLGSGSRPNGFVVSSVLKGCSASGVLEMGLLVHGLVVKLGMGFDRFVEVGLVDMYAKCGDLDGAVKAFYGIPVKSPVAWNAMLSGYVQSRRFMEAAELFQEMLRIGLAVDLVTLRVVADAASSLEMFDFCKNLHVYAMKIGMDSDSFVVAELIRLLAKLGEVEYMGRLFEKVKRPDVSLYSLLISGYHLHGHRVKAVRFAEELLVSDSSPKQGALVSVLNICSIKKEGTQVHGHILKAGYLSLLCVGNALISMYIKFGELLDANLTFLGMPVRDVVSWTAIMAGFAQHFHFEEALETFLAFRRTGIQLDEQSVATSLNACTGLRDIVKGKQIHALGLKLRFEFSKFMNASLLHMYAKCGYIKSASSLFSFTSSIHDPILTNIMLSGYCWNFHPRKSLELFIRECRVGLVPDQFSLSTILGACADIRSLELGEQMHCRVAKSGFEISDVVVGNAVINMYVKSGSMASACKFFYSVKRWNASSYEILMLGYIQNRESGEALRLFHQMQQSGFQVTPVTFARILRGCADLAAIDLGKQIHASMIKMGLISYLFIGNALVGMYSKSKNSDRERKASFEMPVKDDIQNGQRGKTLQASGMLQFEEVTQNWYSYSDVLNPFPLASNNIYEAFLLSHVVQNDQKFDLLVGKPVFHLQTKCESSGIVLDIPDETLVREEGCIPSVSQDTPVKFKVMQVEGLLPDHVILVAFLSDIRQFGLVDKTFKCYSSIQKTWTVGNPRGNIIAEVTGI